MSHHIRGLDRDQVQMLPPCVEDYVTAEAPVRFIDAYVDGLDLAKLGFSRCQPKVTGRPAYHPDDLLELCLYGCLHRIRSSRRLEAAATRKLELFGAELVAVDGSKFKALNSPRRHLGAAQLREILQRIDEHIEACLRDLDSQDQEAATTSSQGGGDAGGGGWPKGRTWRR